MPKKNKPKLSVVIPAYNEAIRFQRTLPRIGEFFRQKDFLCEIIIVDDGSTDNTVELVTRFTKKFPQIQIYEQTKNAGKGAALRRGFKESRGEYVLFMDADLSTPLKELDNFWVFTENYSVIIGSRKMKGAKVTQRQTLIRESLGKVFTFLTNVLATGNISDVTCGFKLYKGNVGRSLFKFGVLDDWSFDAEILYLAQKYGYKLKEVPVEWKDDPRTKVNMARDGIKALRGLFKIRLNDIQGVYPKKITA